MAGTLIDAPTQTARSVDRDPDRLVLPLDRWSSLSSDDKAAVFALMDREIDEVGIVIVAEALSATQCDEFTAIIDAEIANFTAIERRLHAWPVGNATYRDTKGYKVFNFQSRHPAAMELIAFPLVVEYFRRYLGASMVLHSSEGAVIPPGCGKDFPLHFDGYDRIPGHFLSMNAIFYLCDANAENGATRFIPGTHKEFISRAEAAQRPWKHAEVRKGDLILFNPYLFHAGSENRSHANRPTIINYYQRGYIRQGFDYPRAMSLAERRKLTATQRTLLGFDHQVPADVDELYLQYRGPKNPLLADMDPLRP